MSNCNNCGKWAGAHATLPGQSRDHLCHCAPRDTAAGAVPAAPEHGTRDDLQSAMSLMATFRAAQTNGEALAAVLAYRHGIRLEALAAAPKAAPAEPVAAQSRFRGREWKECAIQHAKMVQAKPSEWPDYEVRLLYAAAPTVAPAEPRKVYLVCTGETHEGQETYTRHDDAPPPLCDSECLYTHATAPTVAQPLTDELWLKLRTAKTGRRLRRNHDERQRAEFLDWMRWAENTLREAWGVKLGGAHD